MFEGSCGNNQAMVWRTECGKSRHVSRSYCIVFFWPLSEDVHRFFLARRQRVLGWSVIRALQTLG